MTDCPRPQNPYSFNVVRCRWFDRVDADLTFEGKPVRAVADMATEDVVQVVFLLNTAHTLGLHSGYSMGKYSG